MREYIEIILLILIFVLITQVLAHTSNPSTWGSKKGQEFKVTLSYRASSRNPQWWDCTYELACSFHMVLGMEPGPWVRQHLPPEPHPPPAILVQQQWVVSALGLNPIFLCSVPACATNKSVIKGGPLHFCVVTYPINTHKVYIFFLFSFDFCFVLLRQGLSGWSRTRRPACLHLSSAGMNDKRPHTPSFCLFSIDTRLLSFRGHTECSHRHFLFIMNIHVCCCACLHKNTIAGMEHIQFKQMLSFRFPEASFYSILLLGWFKDNKTFYTEPELVTKPSYGHS